jgi:DNA-directed RNA polymerase specialized sigma subunit
MDPDKIELENLSKSFEYFKVSSEIDNLDNIEQVKNIAKCYYKLYLKQQEVVINLGVSNVYE